MNRTCRLTKISLSLSLLEPTSWTANIQGKKETRETASSTQMQKLEGEGGNLGWAEKSKEEMSGGEVSRSCRCRARNVWRREIRGGRGIRRMILFVCLSPSSQNIRKNWEEQDKKRSINSAAAQPRRNWHPDHQIDRSQRRSPGLLK